MGTFRTGIALTMALAIFSCGTNQNKSAKTTNDAEAKTIAVPEFNADSAYRYVEAQVEFGPRVPNTEAHVACGNYIAATLERFGATVTNQYMDLTRYDGTRLKARNIIGSYLPEAKKRVALFAHWDSRPWADKDEDPSKHQTPILGANDGASGVGILLEIGRLLQQQPTAIGIDLICFDAEDCGSSSDTYKGDTEETWCLGSQYWSRIPHVPGYNARFGILLDMVGGKGAVFYREAYSLRFAKSIVDKVWEKARKAGYGSFFIQEDGGGATDDHVFVNRIARIPTIDIIPMDEDYGFGDFWHTTGDTMEAIDRTTLKAVGQTVLEVIYNEK